MESKRNNKNRLYDIIDSAELIDFYLSQVNEQEFFNSMEKQDAVLRRLIIIGEAVASLSDEFKKEYSGIEWHKAAGMRNILIHEYFDLDEEIIWNTLISILPNFKSQVQEIYKNLKV